MKILSLFDGIACGRVALERAGIPVDKYYASEIDKYAIAITRYNYPDTIFVGDIRQLKSSNFKNIDLIMGGSPCQSFSMAGKRKGMTTKSKIEVTSFEQYLKLKEEGFEFEGHSYLFWEFVRLLKEVKHKWFLLENVKMPKKWKDIITNALKVEPIEINSALVSAQNRKRLYWTNIPIKELPEDKGILLKDILEDNVDMKYYIKKPFRYLPKSPKFIIDPYNKKNITHGKATTLRTNYSNGNCWINESLRCNQIGKLDIKGQDAVKRIYSSNGKSPTLTTMQGGYRQPKILVDKTKSSHKIRRLTPVECERLQTLPDNYTKYGLLNNKIITISDTQRYKTIGNGWTVDIIAHILYSIKQQGVEK